jgi:nicotinate dehydrogenase subunit B
MKKEISRRDFVKASGALVVCFSTAALVEPYAMGQGPFDTHQSHIDPGKLDSWLAVASDGTVTAYTGKCDFGQGMYTVQTQLVAEELCISINKVKLIQCDTSVTTDQGTTSGSQSTPTNFNTQNLAQAAATARAALVGMAAQRLGVSVDQLTIENGVVIAKNGRHVGYDELVAGKHFDIAVSFTATPITKRMESAWETCSVGGSRCADGRHVRIRSQRTRAGHGSRSGRASAGGRSNGCERGREIGAARSRSD